MKKIIFLLFIILLLPSCFTSVKDDEWITGDDDKDTIDISQREEKGRKIPTPPATRQAPLPRGKLSQKNLAIVRVGLVPTHLCPQKHQASKNQSQLILIILPLSGELKSLGLRLKNAIIKINEELEEPYNLAFFDTGSDLFYKKGELYDFVVKNDIKFIIGGLQTNDTKDIADVAGIKKIPVFSLSPNSKLAQHYKNLFIQSITPENITYSIVKYAIEEKGFKKFAILYPFTEIGEEYNYYFKYFVDSMGGEVTKSVTFNTKNSNLDKPISKLVERDRPYQRPEFARLIRKANRFKDPYWRKRYINRAKMKLSAKFDYDAIFLPISNKRVNYIVPVLAAWDLPLQTNNQRLMEQVYHKYLNKNQKYVQVFGTPFWYDEKLFLAGSPYINGSIFPSPHNVELDNLSIPFVALFQKRIEKKQSLIYEALVYDLLNIIYYVFDKKEAIDTYDGVMGRYSLYKNQLFKDFGMTIIHNDRFLTY